MALLQQIKVPLLSVNDTTLTIIELTFKNGEKIKKDDIIMIFETSKTTYDVMAEFDGYIQYIAEAGKDYAVNEVVASIFSEATDIKQEDKIILNGTLIKKQPEGVNHHLWEGEPLFSMEAAALIEKHGFDKTVFSSKDFISKQDVEEQFNLTNDRESTPAKFRQANENIFKITSDLPKVKYQKLSSTKKREIEYLSAVQSSGLVSTINISVDTFGIFFHLNQSLKYLKNSFLPIIVYECSRLLSKYPLLNAFFNEDDIGVYEEVNIGFAIDANKGLKVLKINNTNSKNIYEIEEEIMQLSDLYLQDKLTVQNLSDITFTITDLSSQGVSSFQPLINMNNCAILGISAIDDKLNRCNLSITFDHRVTEGKVAAIFLRELKERLESYRSLKSKDELTAIKCFKCHKTLAEDISEVGFAKCITTTGKESYVCQSCFKGF